MNAPLPKQPADSADEIETFGPDVQDALLQGEQELMLDDIAEANEVAGIN